MANKGVIYILTNPSFPQYVKIGYADNVESRLRNTPLGNIRLKNSKKTVLQAFREGVKQPYS